jgi:hypothetical protein
MFRTSYVHLQEDYTVHPVLWAYGNATIWYNKACRHNACTNACKIYHIRLHVQYSLPADEHTIFETFRGKEELNYNINFKNCILLANITQLYHSARYKTHKTSYEYLIRKVVRLHYQQQPTNVVTDITVVCYWHCTYV